MTRPITDPKWATDTNYTNGPEVGTVTKVVPSAGVRAEGALPDTIFAAQRFNAVINEHGAWLDHYKEIDWLNWVNRFPSNEDPTMDDTLLWCGIAFCKPVAYAARSLVVLASGKTYNASGFGMSKFQSRALPAGIDIATGVGGFRAARPIMYSAVADKYIVVGESASSAGEEIATADGSTVPTTWTARTDPAAAANRTSIAESGSIVVVSRSAGGFITSTDGITWTERTHPQADKNVRDVIWAPALGIFCAVTATGKVLTSSNGTAWTDRGNPNAASDFYSITWNEHHGKFVACSFPGIQTSADGISWTVVGGGGGANFLDAPRFCFANGPESFIYAGFFNRSIDGGSTWQPTDAHGIGKEWRAGTVVDGRIMLVGGDGVNFDDQKPTLAASMRVNP
jgi:hypothetical protein